LLKTEFKRYRNDVKNIQKDDNNMLGVNEQQISDHPITFMKMINRRETTISAANNERLQVLSTFVIWDGSIERFNVFRNGVEGHHGQFGAGYLFETG
jgi:hypothetical protein